MVDGVLLLFSADKGGVWACLLQNVVALELHGTGTPLGDPIEIGAATAVHAGAFALLV